MCMKRHDLLEACELRRGTDAAALPVTGLTAGLRLKDLESVILKRE